VRTISTGRVLPPTLQDAKKALGECGLLVYLRRYAGPTLGVTIHQPSEFLYFFTDGDNV
jgi:hypothetical protein